MNSYEIFVAIVKQGSFSAAAKHLHRSPSAISKQISQLEQKLGVQLFDRTTRVLRLTEAGRIYHERALDIARRVQDAEAELKDFSGEPSGVIRITWPNALSSSKIIDVIADFSKRNPKITFDINVSVQRLNLVENSVDFAFRLGPLEDSSMVAIQLFDIEPTFCAAPSFIDTFGFPTDLQAAFELPLLIPSNVNLVQQMRKLMPDLDWSRCTRISRGLDIPTFLNLSRKGAFASFCFKHMIDEDLKSGSLIEIPLPIPQAKLPVYLVYQNYQHMPAKNRGFIDAVKHAFL